MKPVDLPALTKDPRPPAAERYTVRLAQGRHDVEAALRLRFEVFNLELHEGLAESFFTGLDEDEFDQFCDHLIVVDEPNGKVVGTYRMQTGEMAARSGQGYYSAREFDFTPYHPIRHSLIELGRACVQKDHRSFAVITLLWKAIISYALERRGRFLIGCSSLTSQDPALGSAMFHQLSRNHLAPRSFQTQPLPALAIPMDPCPTACGPPPRLLRAYLSVGAKICGPPAIDREFGTIDFLTLLDINNSPLNAQARFLPRR
ncbi:MAG TPA: GNAT family N-acyltransferase [Terrimicrobiaceae bacterium]|nr:GNAT family N-acyltransferase [Terrimicrobiaceae bacterium]